MSGGPTPSRPRLSFLSRIGSPERGALDFPSALENELAGLYRYARRLTRDSRDAEDLLQETALRAFDRLHQLRGVERFKPWIYTIMTHLYYNLYRQRRARPEVSMEELPWEGEALTAAEQAEIFRQVTAQEVLEAVEALPEEYRSSVWLGDVEGFSNREIADILHIPIGTVASRIHRGRGLLRGALADWAIERGYRS